jgi:ATP-dependent Lhr-like helicase
LRELRHLPVSNEIVTISAADPMNLVGILVPGERIPAVGQRSVRFRSGIYIPEINAEHPPTTAAEDSSEEELTGRGATG